MVVDHPPRILLVDDEQSIQTLLSYPLRKDGYDVVQATDGREALARFGESSFDLVVLDVMMPQIDGLEVCRRLRAKSSVPRRSVVFPKWHTNCVTPESANACTLLITCSGVPATATCA